jgi:NitT/TauT family transport system substrate-binding protein
MRGVFDAVYLGTLSIADRHKYVIIKKDLINKSLKGQTVGMFLIDPSNKYLLSTYLKTVNTSLADVRLVTMNSHDELESNFIRDQLSVVLALDRGNNFYEKANGVIAISTHDFYEPHGLIAIRKDPLKTIPPEDLKKILRGCIEAIQWIRDPANWEEYKGILSQYFLAGRSDLSDEQFRELTKEGKFFDPQILLAHNQQQLSDYFTEVRHFFASEGIVKADVLNAFMYDKVIYNQPLIEVLQEYVQ